jgi:hypothetical protein
MRRTRRSIPEPYSGRNPPESTKRIQAMGSSTPTSWCGQRPTRLIGWNLWCLR